VRASSLRLPAGGVEGRPGRQSDASAGSPVVSVVIATYNRLSEVRLNLVYLLARRFAVPMEVIVVDDGSTDGTVEAMAAFPQVRLLCMGRNSGPAAARNVAIGAARGKYILFLDSDGVLSRRGLSEAVHRMEREPDIAVLGGRIVNFYSRRLDQWIYGQSPRTHYRQTFDTYSFSAAGALVRTEAVRRVGGFWEELFIYNEEVDLSIRLLRAGWRVLYCPDLCVYHHTSPDRRAGGPRYWYLQVRNRLWITLRYYPAHRCLRRLAMYAAMSVLKGLRNGQVVACLAGVWAGIRGLRKCRRFGDQISVGQMRHIESLNPRLGVRWGQ
jgi:GT2 family glycosyltransferase